MKKTLLFALLLSGSITSLAAKELSFTFEGTPVANGGSIVYTEYEVYPYTEGETEIFIKPEIYLSKDGTGTVSVRTTSDYPVQLCIGGQCEASETILKENLNFGLNVPQDLELDCSFYFKDTEAVMTVPKINVLVEAWYSNDPSTVWSVNVVMGGFSGIDDVAGAENSVSVNGKTLAYVTESPAEIAVYNLSGRAVASYTVNGTGSLSLANLPAGIYMYRAAGKINKTGKFVIR